jgi:serine/threonine protein kinase
MQQFRAFTSSFTSAAKEFARDITSAANENAVTGRQYQIKGKNVVEEKLLSEGGFGFVYLVRDLATGSKYAMKKILCMDKENLDMAMREVEIFEKLPAHPNLVKYFGHTVLKESRNREVVILLEFCPGGHLYDLMKTHPGGVPSVKILRAMLDTAKGLSALHSMKPPIQHRDLKLENILMSSSGNYVILDFGSWGSDSPNLSDLSREDLMRFGESVERYTTLMYRPPEMADLYKGFQVSTKVDIWMLGCILFTLINNKHPFQDASNLAIVNCKFSHNVDMCKQRPAKLVHLCDWLLAQNPQDRPDANQLVSLLENWDDETPLPSLPKSVLDRIEKDSKLLGIAGDAKKKPPKIAINEGGWGTGETTHQQSKSPKWKADFGDLLDIQVDHVQSEKDVTEAVGIDPKRRSSAPIVELPNLLD